MKHDDKEMETEAKYTDHGTENKNKNEIVERYETNNRKGVQDNGCGNGYCGDAVDLEKLSPFEPEKRRLFCFFDTFSFFTCAFIIAMIQITNM